MEVFFPPESPEVGVSVVEGADGPELYQLEPLAAAPVMPEAGALHAMQM